MSDVADILLNLVDNELRHYSCDDIVRARKRVDDTCFNSSHKPQADDMIVLVVQSYLLFREHNMRITNDKCTCREDA